MAEERGYQPNIIASSLRSNKTNTIGIITSWINRPFISSLISGVEMAANKSGFNVIISQSHDSYENEVANAKTLYGSRIEGLVVSLAMETTNYDHFQKFLKKNIPVVFVDRVPDDLNTTKVVINNYESGFKATEHLIEQGCKRIAHIGGVRHRNVYSERMNGYVAALKKHGLEVDSNLIVESDRLSSEEGYRIAEYLINLDARPDGVFSANDTAAVSFIKYTKSVGVNVPEDIAVIGFNNDPISTIIDPALSTVSHPAFEMGKLVAAQVLNQGRLPSELIQAQTIMLETELIIRESTLREKH